MKNMKIIKYQIKNDGGELEPLILDTWEEALEHLDVAPGKSTIVETSTMVNSKKYIENNFYNGKELEFGVSIGSIGSKWVHIINLHREKIEQKMSHAQFIEQNMTYCSV